MYVSRTASNIGSLLHFINYHTTGVPCYFSGGYMLHGSQVSSLVPSCNLRVYLYTPPVSNASSNLTLLHYFHCFLASCRTYVSSMVSVPLEEDVLNLCWTLRYHFVNPSAIFCPIGIVLILGYPYPLFQKSLSYYALPAAECIIWIHAGCIWNQKYLVSLRAIFVVSFPQYVSSGGPASGSISCLQHLTISVFSAP